jgi:L-lactate utilization protein LutB
MSESVEAFARDFQSYVMEALNESLTSYVTEQGDVEDWKNNDAKFKAETLKKLDEYLTNLRASVK